MNNGQRIPRSRLQPQPPGQPPERPIPTVDAALESKISLHFPNVRGFLNEYSSQISLIGMFLRSNDLRRPGTVLEFDLTLLDGLKLIRGTGEVVWSHIADSVSGQTSGMGIRFLRLDPASRRLIHWAVDKHRLGGAKPFDLLARQTTEVDDSCLQQARRG